MNNPILNLLNKNSDTNIKEKEVFTFTTSSLKRRFNGLVLEFYRNSNYLEGWTRDNTNYNTLLKVKIKPYK